jgi:hypothetical protein
LPFDRYNGVRHGTGRIARFTVAGHGVTPLARAVVVASRHGARQAAALGWYAFIEGGLLDAVGLLAAALVVADEASPIPLILALGVSAYRQGLVMAPLPGAELAAKCHAHAGSGVVMLTAVPWMANSAGEALIGGLYFAVQPATGDAGAPLVSLPDAVIARFATAALMALVSGMAGEPWPGRMDRHARSGSVG